MKRKKNGYLGALLALCLAFLLSSCTASYKKADGYAMGTLVSVTAKSEKNAADAVASVSMLEREISHKISGSLISALNRGESVALPAELFEALALSLEVEEKTNGAFTVRILPLTSLWNFDTGVLPSDEDIAAALAEIDQSRLMLDAQATLSSGGLDLGAIGKGMAADALVENLKKKGDVGVVSVGGSIGALGDKNGEGWRIGIRDPFSSSYSDTVGTLRLADAFVSTSGSYEKTFSENGRTYHHILDAKTGMPVENELVSVTVVAESGVLSDVLSTALFAVGIEKGAELCREYGAHALFICRDGSLWATDGFLSLFSTEKEVNRLEK